MFLPGTAFAQTISSFSTSFFPTPPISGQKQFHTWSSKTGLRIHLRGFTPTLEDASCTCPSGVVFSEETQDAGRTQDLFQLTCSFYYCSNINCIIQIIWGSCCHWTQDCASHLAHIAKNSAQIQITWKLDASYYRSADVLVYRDCDRTTELFRNLRCPFKGRTFGMARWSVCAKQALGPCSMIWTGREGGVEAPRAKKLWKSLGMEE